jgi:hypothetical protein
MHEQKQKTLKRSVSSTSVASSGAAPARRKSGRFVEKAVRPRVDDEDEDDDDDVMSSLRGVDLRRSADRSVRAKLDSSDDELLLDGDDNRASDRMSLTR